MRSERYFADVYPAKCYSKLTPLHVAALYGNEEVTALLISHGAEVWSLDGDGNKALHLACGNGHQNVVNLLLTLEPTDVDAQDGRGLTSLMRAVIGNHAKVIQ